MIGLVCSGYIAADESILRRRGWRRGFFTNYCEHERHCLPFQKCNRNATKSTLVSEFNALANCTGRKSLQYSLTVVQRERVSDKKERESSVKRDD